MQSSERMLKIIEDVKGRTMSSINSIIELVEDFFVYLRSIIEFKIRRFICWLFGCKIKGGHGGFNLPDEAYSYYCTRCWAGKSNYEGDSPYEIYEGNIFRRIK